MPCIADPSERVSAGGTPVLGATRTIFREVFWEKPGPPDAHDAG